MILLQKKPMPDIVDYVTSKRECCVRRTFDVVVKNGKRVVKNLKYFDKKDKAIVTYPYEINNSQLHSLDHWFLKRRYRLCNC